MKYTALDILLSGILLTFYLNGNQDVSGESVCGPSPGFHCANSSGCVERYQYCNAVNDCGDGSDEIVFNSTLHHTTGISCGKLAGGAPKQCYLPNRYVCNHELDCFFGEDESNCSHTFDCGLTSFGRNQYKIRIQFCDKVKNCLNNADEIPYSIGIPGFQCSVTKTHLTNYCMLPEQYVCDGTNDCDYGTDECFCTNSNDYVGASCFRCLNRQLVIPNTLRCDGSFHCNDLSDECLCSNPPPICNQLCKIDDNCGSCKLGEIKCKAGVDGVEKCINRTSVCDQIVDCPNREDENNCRIDTSQLFLCHDNKQFIPKYQRCNEHFDCNDTSDEQNCTELYHCTNPPVYEPGSTSNNLKRIFDRAVYTESCDKLALCEDLDDECNATICGNDLPGYCAHVQGPNGFICPNSQSALIGKEICDGFPTCNESSRATSADEQNCTNRFYCSDHGATRLPIHIPLKAHCNAITDCYDGSDEENCSTTTHFYCEPGTAQYIPRAQVCNGVFDCAKGQDECQNCAISPFSSDKFLINNYVLQAFIWIIGLLAILGNIAVIVHNGREIHDPKGTSAIALSNRILVLNLALADLLLGVYLLAIGIINSVYANNYCLKDIEWRTSSSCAGLGTVAVISVETSVFILTIMTTFRLILVTRPFNSNVKVENIVLALAVVWTISFILALVPLTWFQIDYFANKAWFTNNPYLTVSTRKEVENFAQLLWSLEDQNTTYFSSASTALTWENMVASISLLGNAIAVKRYFGYYSAHGVCLPLLFPDPQQDKAWGFSLLLIIINFMAFMYMVIAYIVVYQFTKQRAKKAGSSEKAATKLQKKVTRIVISNFCCWIPICIMAFISVGGTKLSSETYAVAAIVLLPINSAANPFLYSSLPDLIWAKLKPFKDRGGKTEESRSISGATSKQTELNGVAEEDTKM